MKTNTFVLFLCWLLLGCIAFAQKKTADAPGTIKTIRLHLDGFQKSKSGAV